MAQVCNRAARRGVIHAERLRLSPGSLLGGGPDGRLLIHGPALVCRRHGHFHRPHRLLEDGERVQRSGRAASVPGGQVGAAQFRNDTFRGLLPPSECDEGHLSPAVSDHCHREQRITGILVFALTGVSIFLAPVLKVDGWNPLS